MYYLYVLFDGQQGFILIHVCTFPCVHTCTVEYDNEIAHSECLSIVKLFAG